MLGLIAIASAGLMQLLCMHVKNAVVHACQERVVVA